MNKQKKPWLARLLVLVLACSFAFTITLDSASSAHAQTASSNHTQIALTGGGMDLMGYCRSLGYVSVRTVGTTYYDWRCISSIGNDVQFSMRAACQWQYHNVNMWDLTQNFYSATGGWCWQANLIGGINARGYCQSKGYTDVALLGNTAYDWYCAKPNPFQAATTLYTRILNSSPGGDDPNMLEACWWMYPNVLTNVRFDNFYVPTSWQCIG